MRGVCGVGVRSRGAKVLYMSGSGRGANDAGVRGERSCFVIATKRRPKEAERQREEDNEQRRLRKMTVR